MVGRSGGGGPPPGLFFCKDVKLKGMGVKSLQECDSKGVRLTGGG
jgi:hypothetical protein